MDSRQLEIDRMFKKKGRGPLLESCQVKKLSKAMFEGNNKFQESTKESNESREIPAGYTYFFQLISHDIVPSTTETNSRVVTPELSLDSIYGQGEHGFSPELFNGQGQFIHRNSLDFDVWREQSSHSPRNYIANIPEQRNDENLIVVQLHRLLQKFHNIVVQSIQENEPTKKILKAKEYVVAIFQTIVIEDALDKVLHPCIHKYFFKDNGSFYYQITSEFKIPYEFSHAAFRFGHSMVRSQYLLNNSNEEPTGLRNILRRGKESCLLAEECIEWGRFFGNHECEDVEDAEDIDLLITDSMGEIPKLNSNLGKMSIVEKNLEAGEIGQLRSAEEIIALIKCEDCFCDFRRAFSSTLDELTLKLDGCRSLSLNACEVLTKTQNENRTPLWLYVLHENETKLKIGNSRGLGFLGSAIVGDVVRESIKSAYANSGIYRYNDVRGKINDLVKEAAELLEFQEVRTMRELIFLTERRGSNNDENQ